jgi:hypothetical protein
MGSTVRWGTPRGLFGGTATVVTAAPGERGAPRATRPATGVAQLLGRVDDLHADPAAPRATAALPGTVRVEQVQRPGGSRVAVVYVPGTQTWGMRGGSDPLDGGTDVRALAGERTAAGSAVTAALELAGVTRNEPLLLVGHSQGGLTAAQLASDPGFRSRFSPVGVLTAGSPIGAAHEPPDVAVLSLEHTDDDVPRLDGARDPATPTRTTVTAATPAGHGPHDLTGYAATGALVDTSDDPSITAWRELVRPFLAGGGATSVTTDWVARRDG